MKEVAERCGSYLCVIVSPHRLAYGPQMVRNKVILYCLPSPEVLLLPPFPSQNRQGLWHKVSLHCHTQPLPTLSLATDSSFIHSTFIEG